MVFYTDSYNGHPREIHRNTPEKTPLTVESFARWRHIFNETVDQLFEGEKAEFAKQCGKSIAIVQ